MTITEKDLIPMPKKAAAPSEPTPIRPKKTRTGRPAAAVKTPTPPPLDTSMMNEILLAVHDKAEEINEARAVLDGLITESDQLVREAVDDGERYRDIAAAAKRTVPWVQMSLRRVAGVATHPAAPIPDTRVRKARRAS